MRVQRVVSPRSGQESWTVIGDDHRPVAPVERYLAWLSRIERSPNTVRAYAQDLKTFWEFLAARDLAWDRLTLEQLGQYTAWLRQPADNVVLLAGAVAARRASTVNRMLSAVMGFYEFHARDGVAVARVLVDRARSGRGHYKPFLDGIAPARGRARVGRLPEARSAPRTLTLEQVTAVLGAQRRLRDRFLFALLFGTGMRIGQALGLRHCDVVSHERRIEIVAREDNANGARGKRGHGSVPVSGELMRLHSDYMHVEYGELDCDYVFVNLWAGQVGRPMRYANVAELVARTRTHVGFHFTAHMFRHTYATLARRRGVPLDIVSRLLTHSSVQTTSAIYCHASPQQLRAELEQAGVLDVVGSLT
ncbi:MAG: site-specific integrase [Actinobacteria bacterium]|nr:site-specific integrase [Actinomycetota bacterium]